VVFPRIWARDGYVGWLQKVPRGERCILAKIGIRFETFLGHIYAHICSLAWVAAANAEGGAVGDGKYVVVECEDGPGTRGRFYQGVGGEGGDSGGHVQGAAGSGKQAVGIFDDGVVARGSTDASAGRAEGGAGMHVQHMNTFI
jgi:hypothetical protein